MASGDRAVRWERFEVAAVVACLLGLVGPAVLGLPASKVLVSRSLGALTSLLPLAFVVGLGAQVLMRLPSREKTRDYVRLLGGMDWWVLWLRLWLACLVTSSAYFWAKLCVPLLNPRSFDEELWQFDRFLHLGVSPSRAALEWLPPSPLLSFLDYAYGTWLLSVFAVLAIVSASPRAGFKRAFVLSCLCVWIGGATLYAAVPAKGPAYEFPSLARELAVGMPIAMGTQEQLGGNYDRVVSAGREGLGAAPQVDPTRGVAALPSLHVAFHALFALWAWSDGRRWFPLATLLVLVTWVGSVRTGWHYAVDAYVGFALAWAAWWFARKVSPTSEPVGAERPTLESA